MKKIIICLLATMLVYGMSKMSDFSGVTETNPGIQADSVCFSRDVLPIFLSNCAMSGCHDASTHSHGIDVSSYTSIMKGISAGNPSGSKYYRAMLGSGDDKMPPYPRTPVSAAQLNTISIWITQGAINTDCSANCDTTNVTFTGTIKPIISNFCLGCHSGSGAQGGVDLSNDATVQSMKARIYLDVSRVAGSHPMPPSSAVDGCSLKQINIWANGGTVTPTPCDTTNITYKNQIVNLLTANCIACHNATTQSGGVSLIDSAYVYNQRHLIYNAIQGIGVSRRMPPPPSPALDSCSNNQFRIWSNITIAVQPTPCDTTYITYANPIKSILTTYCISCHNPSLMDGNINLTDGLVVYTQRALIYNSIKGTGVPNRMPKGLPALDTCSDNQMRIYCNQKDSVTNYSCDTVNFTYDKDIKQILSTNCISCHYSGNPSAGLDFTIDSVNKTDKALIYNSVSGNSSYKQMPLSGKLDWCSIAQIRVWSQKPEISGGCDTTNVTYNGTIKPLIVNKGCLGCHTGANTYDKGIDLTNDSITIANRFVILAGVSNQSGHIAMPLGTNGLDTCSIKLIRIWANGVTDVQDNQNTPIINFVIAPNPSYGSAFIKYEIIQESYIGIEIYDETGKPVAEYPSMLQEAGQHEAILSSERLLVSGTYFARLKIDNRVYTKKFVFIR